MFESSRQLIPVIAAVCPRSEKYSRPVNASQPKTPPLRSPVASSTPSGLYSKAVIQSVCFLLSSTFSPSLVGQMRISLFGPPSAICVWSAEMSAASTASVSSPTSMIFSPLVTLQTTALPDCPPRPPAARSRLPLRLNFSTVGKPYGNGRTPASASVSVLYSRIWRCPATATSGDHGLAAIAVTAFARWATTIGSAEYFAGSGIGGAPAGRPRTTDVRLTSVFGFIATTLLPEFSSAPPSIHILIVSSVACGSLSAFGGMNGWTLCETVANSRLPSASPGFTTAPEPPPSISLAKLVMSSPPFILSESWQAKHFSRRIDWTLSWYVIFFAPAFGGSAAKEGLTT